MTSEPMRPVDHANCPLVSMAVASALCALLAGCASTAKEMAKEAAPSAIEQSLLAMNRENNQRLLAHILMDPDVEQATRQVSRSIVQGAVTAFLIDEGAQEEFGERSEQYAVRMSAAAGRTLQAQLEPAMQGMVRSAVRSSIDELLSVRTQGQVQALAAAVTSSAMRAFADSLRTDLGPATEEVVQRNLGASTRAIATQATLGVTDALTQTNPRKGGAHSLLGRVQRLLSSGITLTQWIALILGVALLGLAFWVYKLTAQTRRERAESERREAAMLLLTQAIRSTEGKPWSSELQETIRNAIRDGESAEYLGDLLQRHSPQTGARTPA